MISNNTLFMLEDSDQRLPFFVSFVSTLPARLKMPTRSARIRLGAARLIVVAADHYIGVAEKFLEPGAPLARAHRICRGRDILHPQCLHVLFALDDDDDTLGRNRFNQFRQLEWYGAHALDGPLFLVGFFALAELFRLAGRLEAQHLKQSLTAFINVIESRLDWAKPAVTLFRLIEFFATALLAVVAVPSDAITIDLDVQIALTAR